MVRTITNYNLPSGEKVVAYDDEMMGYINWLNHNPHIAKEQQEFGEQVKEAKRLLDLQARGATLDAEQLQFIQDVRIALGEAEPPKPKPKRKPRKTKAQKEAEAKLAEASQKDLKDRGIK